MRLLSATRSRPPSRSFSSLAFSYHASPVSRFRTPPFVFDSRDYDKRSFLSFFVHFYIPTDTTDPPQPGRSYPFFFSRTVKRGHRADRCLRFLTLRSTDRDATLKRLRGPRETILSSSGLESPRFVDSGRENSKRWLRWFSSRTDNYYERSTSRRLQFSRLYLRAPVYFNF